MKLLGDEMTLENLDKRLGIEPKKTKPKEVKKQTLEEISQQMDIESPNSFLIFYEKCVKEADYASGTLKRKQTVLTALKNFKKIKKFEDLTPANILKFHEWLDDSDRTLATIGNYHKSIHKCIMIALKKGYIDTDPYAKVDIPRGKSKVRKPLTEDELLKILHHKFEDGEEKVRDLFIFSAYTGLAFSDVMNFKYKSMTDTNNGKTFIDGQRVKTGSDYYTPILSHAMDILEKYNYRLPHFTNEYINRTLKDIRSACGINKPMTFHIARHSFATLCITYDVPIEEVSKMLGHKDIRTTQIYAKVLKSTVAKHANKLMDKIQ